MAQGKLREMPKPTDDKQPLKCNVYDFARNLTSTLTPLFPYVDEGAIVPTIALFYGGQKGDYGYFLHDNTVDEVAIIFGAGGTTGRGVTGLVRTSARSHGVGNLLSDPTSPDSFSLVTITQRQATGEVQRESIAQGIDADEVHPFLPGSVKPRQRESDDAQDFDRFNKSVHQITSGLSVNSSGFILKSRICHWPPCVIRDMRISVEPASKSALAV